MTKRKIYPFFLSQRGCSQQCVYCCQELHQDGGQSWTPATVAAELERRLPVSAEGEIAFYGGSFTLLPEAEQLDFLQVAAAFVACQRASGIRLSTHPAGLSPVQLDRLTRFFVTTVEIGCQSFSDQVLTLSGRGHRVCEVVAGVKRLRARGIRVGLQLMPGLPGADHGEALTSLEAALSLAPDFIRIYPTVVLPGTPLEQLLAQGQYRPWSLDAAVDTVADMLERCRQAGVPVIRTGIPPLDCKPVAGPYHPAFGQLVKSRLWKRSLAAALTQVGPAEARVGYRFLSDAMGHKKSNLSELQKSHGLLAIRPDERLAKEEFLLGSELFPLFQQRPLDGGRYVG